MAEMGLRDLGAFVPGRRGGEPGVAPSNASIPARLDSSNVIVTPPPASVAPRSVFGGDLPSGDDALGIDAPLARLAELVAHRGTVIPLCVGLFGGAGSGKSFALHRLVERVRELDAPRGALGPFLAGLHVQTIDVSTLDDDLAIALAARIHAGLRLPYPDLAREIGHVARDPRLVLRETNETLDDARRRLDGERLTQEESGSRLARLTETVLYEAAGSQVDSFARANRASLENRLTAFGVTGDSIRNFKDLVRTVAESGSGLGLSLRALYAFKGQTRLIILAVVFGLLGYGLGMAIDMQDAWLADLRAGPQAAASTATWLADQMYLLVMARKGAYALAALAILRNLWRAFAFVRPITTGARLLQADLATRRRDLDSLYAHQTKRVDGLAADVDRLVQQLLEAEKRAGGPHRDAGSMEASLFETSGVPAQGFFVELDRLLRQVAPGVSAPRRVVLALDNFEVIAADRAHAIVETVHRIALRCGLVVLIALDPRRIGASAADLERWVQVPLRLDAMSEDRDFTAIVQQALGQETGRAVPRRTDFTRSALDEPVSEQEAVLLAVLAPLAGGSPRAVKRLVNLFTVARLDDDAPKGALALMLALDQGGTVDERRAVALSMAGEPGAALDLRNPSPRLRAALAAVEALDGRLTKSDIAGAASRAALFSVASFV